MSVSFFEDFIDSLKNLYFISKMKKGCQSSIISALEDLFHFTDMSNDVSLIYQIFQGLMILIFSLKRHLNFSDCDLYRY